MWQLKSSILKSKLKILLTTREMQNLRKFGEKKQKQGAQKHNFEPKQQKTNQVTSYYTHSGNKVGLFYQS